MQSQRRDDVQQKSKNNTCSNDNNEKKKKRLCFYLDTLNRKKNAGKELLGFRLNVGFNASEGKGGKN